MTKSWRADELFPHLFRFYNAAEKRLDRRLLYEAPVYRPFLSAEEQNEWMTLSESPSVRSFVKEIFTSPKYPQVYDPFGGILIEQSGYLDVNAFMEGVRNLLKKEGSFSDTFFDPSRLDIDSDLIGYDNYIATSVIFCEGMNVSRNPFFHWLPVRPLKGETITVSIGQTPEAIFNRGVYLVPTSRDKTFIVGATYQPNDYSQDASAQAKTELEGKLKELIKMDYHVTHQNWGIRPSTPDRRPILGAHPLHKNLVVFNGLGTKGVSLAPYFSAHLADWIEGKTEIQNEVNIQRFKALYSK